MGGTQANGALRQILDEVGWSPYELARKVNKVLPVDRRVHPTTAFAWRDRGTLPRQPLPSVIAGVLTEARGSIVTAEQLWPQRTTHAATVMWRPAINQIETNEWIPTDALGLSSKIPGSGPTYFAASGDELRAAVRTVMFGHHRVETQNTFTGTTGVSSEFVDYLEHDLANLRRLDDGHGGRLLTRTVDLRLVQISEVLRDCSHTTVLARRLLSVAGQMAQMAGWLAFDRGEHGLAQRLYLVGLRAATAAKDELLCGLILSCIALQQAWRGRGHDAVSIMNTVDRAIPFPTPPRVRALIGLRRARAFASTGQHTETSVALENAFQALDSPPHAHEPAWAYWADAAVLANEAGRCYLDLGDTQRAEAHLSAGLERVGDDATRDRVLYGLSLARAHIPHHRSHGDLEIACYQVERVLPLLPDVSSGRCRNVFDGVMTELHRFRTTRAVRGLLARPDLPPQLQTC